MGELTAALQTHFSQIAQAQLGPQPPLYDEEDTIRGIFQKVERRSCTLVTSSLARLSQRNVREPSLVFLVCCLVAVEAQCGQSMAHSSSDGCFPQAYPTDGLHAKSSSEF